MKKEKKYDWTVHYDIAGRKRYKRRLWLVVTGMVLVLCVCAVLFYFGCATWDPEAGFSPAANPKEPWQILMVVLAALLSVGVMVGTTFYCYKSIDKFYRAQAEYFKTKIFRDHKARALNKDLTKLDKKTLKWYKKLGYLNSEELRDILEKQKTKEKETAH